MKRTIKIAMLCLASALALGACGVKGDLKSPSQIERDAQKKQQKQQKKSTPTSAEKAPKI